METPEEYEKGVKKLNSQLSSMYMGIRKGLNINEVN